MSVSLTALEQETLHLLAEAADTPLGELQDGEGGTVVSATDRIDALLWEAARRICRTCVAVRATGTGNVSSNQREVVLKALVGTHAPTSATGYTLFRLTGDPIFGGSRLRFAEENALRAHDPDYRTVTATAATHWYEQGTDSIGLYKVPTSGAALVAPGLATPPQPAGADAAPWLEDGLALELLPRYAAVHLAAANMDDERLALRMPIWMQEWDAGCRERWANLPSDLARFFPPLPPLQPVTSRRKKESSEGT
jgi:hypothetical protein